MDPRVAIIEQRLASIKRIIAVAGGKGGVGKSTVAAALALVLSEMEHKVGLLDLDFYGPSTHVILGDVKGVQPREEKGVVPPVVHGIEFMSIVYYAGDNPVPLRGMDLTNVLIELLAITRWGALDFLVVDMPPGLGDTTLDAIRLLGRAQFLVVTTPSLVTLETVKKLITLLKEVNVPIIGALVNMHRSGDSSVQEIASEIPLLGQLPYDAQLEESLGSTGRFLKTLFARKLWKTVLRTPEFVRR